MKKVIQLVAVALCLAWVVTGPVNANPKMGKDSGKKCADCHTAAGKPELNDFGKKFQACVKGGKSAADCAK